MRLALKVYFRKQYIKGIENIPKEGPFLIVANHPSSFLDPISIAVLINKKISFLAKATMFNNKIAAKVLAQLNLVPIYRAQDNPKKLKENQTVFKACYKKLKNKGAIMIFPEGTSENERRLRKIKTGAARIALGTVKENNYDLNVKILPVGLNYTKSSTFRSELSIHFGEALETKDYIDVHKENETLTAKNLTDNIEKAIKDLIIDIEKQEYDELIEQLEIIYKTELSPNTNLPVEFSQEIVEGVKHFQQYDPPLFNDTKYKIENYFEKLKQSNISDRNIGGNQEKSNLFLSSLKSILKLIVGFPIWLIGMIHSFIPYNLTRVIALAITKEQAFYGALLMSLGTLLFILSYGLAILLSWLIFNNVVLTLIYAISLPFIGFFTIYYVRFARKFYYNLKFISSFYSKNKLITELIIERKNIIMKLDQIKESLKSNL